MTLLANVGIAYRLGEARTKLQLQREGGKVEVSISGQPQDHAMAEATRGAVLAELDRRIAEIDEDLAAIGVEVG